MMIIVVRFKRKIMIYRQLLVNSFGAKFRNIFPTVLKSSHRIEGQTANWYMFLQISLIRHKILLHRIKEQPAICLTVAAGASLLQVQSANAAVTCSAVTKE
jgi:hypothetical protein